MENKMTDIIKVKTLLNSAVTSIQSALKELDVVVVPQPTNTLYVDKAHPAASNANPGTEALPLKDIQAAADKTVPGTTVIIKAGSYLNPVASPFEWTPVLEITRSGTQAAPITFKAYKRPDGKYDTVILNAGQRVARACWIHNANWINIEGLKFIGGQRQGLRLGSGQHGDNPFADPVTHINVRDCVAFDNGMPNTWFGGFEVVGPSRDVLFYQCEAGYNGNGFIAGTAHHTVRDEQPARVRYERCSAHHHTKGDGNSNGLIFEGCVDSQMIKCVSYANSDTGFGSQGPYCDNQLFEDVVAFGQVKGVDSNSRGAQFNNVNPAILLAGHWGGRNTIVRRCWAFDNAFGRGFVDGNGSDGAVYESCVAVRNGASYETGWGFLLESNAGQPGHTHIREGCRITQSRAYLNHPQDVAGRNAGVKFADYNIYGDGQTLARQFERPDFDLHSVSSGVPVTHTITCDTNLWSGGPALRIPNVNFGRVSVT